MDEERDDSTSSEVDGQGWAQQFVSLSIEAGPRAPVFAATCQAIAADPEMARLLSYAPPTQQMPVLLMAAIHRVLLDHPDDELGGWYPNLQTRRRMTGLLRAPDDVELAPAVRQFVDRHRARIVELVATRSTQTNEVGRCALFLPVFGVVGEEYGPLAHVDVGASGGLNLNLDRYNYRYDPGGSVGDPSSVVLTCGTRGAVPVPATMPTITARGGIDLSPIDLADDDAARWLEACVWPDQTDRFERLVAAIEIAREYPVDVVAGNAIDLIQREVDRVSSFGHPVVTNSWVLSYFTSGQRLEYIATLDRIGQGRDLTWVFAESPALAPELPVAADRVGEHGTDLTMVRWRRGTRSIDHLATCHPHGYWIHWR